MSRKGRLNRLPGTARCPTTLETPRWRRALLSSLIIVFGLNGCATFVSLLEPNSPKIFGGVRMSLEAQARACAGETPSYGWTWYPLLFIDLPLSVIADTALLPLTIFLEPDEESLRCPGGPLPHERGRGAAGDTEEGEENDSR